MIAIIAEVATIASGIAAAAALWIARQTVSETRRVARNQTYVTVTQLLSMDRAVRSDRDAVLSLAPDGAWLPEDIQAVRRTLATLNIACVLDLQGMLPPKLLLDQYGAVMARTYSVVGEWFLRERQE